MRQVALLGATGSVGDSTLDVIARHPDRFAVVALAAHSNAAKLETLCRKFRPRYAALDDGESAGALQRVLARDGIATEVLVGPDGLAAIASLPEVDTVLAAIVGATGLASSLAAAAAGKRILLANKEAVVMGGALFMEAVAKGGATLLPIDSEHNAVFQCLPTAYANGSGRAGVRRILLTASGGPFRTRPLADLASVTADEACAHPNWSMGRKISVDSATMMNKGLEVIEARWLFDVPPASIEVVLQPQSVIHSMVEYVDGSVLAHLGHPDMRTPIAHALAYPDRIETAVPSLDFGKLASLAFDTPDPVRFPCLGLAYDALREGGTAPTVLNAANEVAVAAFLGGRIRFIDIAQACAETLSRISPRPVTSLDEARAADAEARRRAGDWIARRPIQGTVAA